MKRYLLLIFSCLLISSGLGAQQIEVASQNIPQEGHFAQPLDVRFAVTHTPSYQVELDEKSLPKDFLLLEKKEQSTSSDSTTYDLTFLPVTLGASTFTAVNFLLLDFNRQTIAQAQSKEAPVQIAPVEFFKDKNMRDIRPPYIPGSWIWWILSAIVAVLLIYFIRRFWKDTRAIKASQTNIDSRPADVIALDKIHLLLQSGLWEKAQYKLFYTELEDILREYLTRRFDIDVSADTSAELLRRLRTIPQLSALQADLRTYLNSSDLVKFAKAAPDESTMQRDVMQVRTVVQTTTPPRELTNQLSSEEQK